jgi:hypothetical protein
VTVADVEREPTIETRTFNPALISPSRVNKLTECGVAFKLYYLDGVPAQVRGSYALFGSVVHKALENWATDREQDLLALMRAAWISETADGPVVQKFLEEYAKINVAVLIAEADAKKKWEEKNPGKESKAPRMTKFFKDSPAAKSLWRLMKEWEPKLNAESPWHFTDRDPLPQFYDDSLVIAKRYQRQWGHLPVALHTEFKFEVEWRGFILNGYIDTVEVALNYETGEPVALLVNDYKTYKKQPAEHKDYRQLVIYDAAVRQMVADGRLPLPFSPDEVPMYVGIDYVRFAGVETDWLKPSGSSRRFWEITAEDHDRVERELTAYRNTVEQRNFLPAAKGTNPEYCDYGELCCLRSTAQAGGCASNVEVAL